MKLKIFILLYAYGTLADVTEYNDVAWKEAADFMHEGHDPNVKPCEDFAKYACGKWLNGAGKTQGQQAAEYDHRLHQNIMEAIESIDVEDITVPEFKKTVKNFFDTCLKENKKVSTRETVKQLYKTVVAYIGTPPILNKDKKANERLMKENFWHLLGRIHQVLPKTGVFFHLEVKIISVDCQGNVPVLLIKPTDSESATEYKDDIVNDFKYLTKILDVKLDEKAVKTRIDEMLKFQKALVDYINQTQSSNKESGVSSSESPTSEEDEVEAVTDAIISLDDLIALNPNVSWTQYFEGLLTQAQFAQFNQSQPMIALTSKRALNNVDLISKQFNTETVFDYIFWRTMKALFVLRNSTANVTPNNEICLRVVRAFYEPAIVRIFLDHMKYDAFEIRYDIEQLAETVFSSFKFLLAGADWLDAEEKVELMKKVNKITFYSGIPDWIANDTELEWRTVPLETTGGSMQQNVFIHQRQKFNQGINLLIGLTDVNSDAEPSLEQNAFYTAMTVNFYLGFILPPFYNPKYPLAAKYGFAGVFIGHELLHGFDNDNVNEKPTSSKSWLKPGTIKEFNRKVNCVKKQYSSYCFQKAKKCVNGAKTISENIADIDGVKVAYMAYKFASLTTGPQPPLPGFTELSADELFFLFSARCRCSTGSELEEWLTANDNGEPHPPDESRYIVPFRNFPIFAKTFGCPVNSDFDPTKVCNIWGQYIG